jgi:hypothetical protein
MRFISAINQISHAEPQRLRSELSRTIEAKNNVIQKPQLDADERSIPQIIQENK